MRYLINNTSIIAVPVRICHRKVTEKKDPKNIDFNREWKRVQDSITDTEDFSLFHCRVLSIEFSEHEVSRTGGITTETPRRTDDIHFNITSGVRVQHVVTVGKFEIIEFVRFTPLRCRITVATDRTLMKNLQSYSKNFRMTYTRTGA